MAPVVIGCYGNTLSVLCLNNIHLHLFFGLCYLQREYGSVLSCNFVISPQKVWRVYKCVQWVAAEESTAKGTMGIEDASNDSTSLRWWYRSGWRCARWKQFFSSFFIALWLKFPFIFDQRERWFGYESVGNSTATRHNATARSKCKKSTAIIGKQSASNIKWKTVDGNGEKFI